MSRAAVRRRDHALLPPPLRLELAFGGRLRAQSDFRAQACERPFRLSMSVGGAYLAVGGDASVEQLLDQADAAMYEQKNARRAAGDVSITPPVSAQ